MRTAIEQIEQSLRQSVGQEKLREWMQFKPLRVAADLALNWAGIFLAFVVTGQTRNPLVWLIALVWIFLRQYALFILGHDGMHFCLSNNHAANDKITRWFIYGPLLMALEDGRKNHLEHHKTLGTPVDPDRYIHTLGNKNDRAAFLLFLAGFSTFGKTVLKVTPLGHLITPSGKTERNQNFAHFCKQRIPIFVTQPLLFAIFIACGNPWWLYPFLWVAPIYLVFVADEIRAFCDHAVALLPDEEADERRLITYLPNAVEAAVFSPHNMNYHAEHHIWPGIPYYNRPMVHASIKDHPEISVKKSYIAFLISLLNSLPLQPSSAKN